ncbi:MAG TPA: N-acetylmuramoyl-L-alanine amidase [Xanthobacteraceae bacterium]|nr:N-acetylmuramoyl-L-alanine amidase [Xanthobacteraceae bacterium]
MRKGATSIAGAMLGLMLAGFLSAVAQAPAAEPRPADNGDYPLATDVRVGGDGKDTRFVVDLSRKVDIQPFTLADPYRVVVDLPQVNFQFPAHAGERGRGLVKAFRYGLVMPGGSRIVLDTTGPVRVDKSFVLDATGSQPARLVLDLVPVTRDAFMRALAVDNNRLARATKPSERPSEKASPPAADGDGDPRPVVVLDPGHGGIDSGTHARTGAGEAEKTLVLDFALMLRDKLQKTGKYRVVMTRSDDTFVALTDRVRFARAHNAQLFISIHCDALARGEGEAEGASVYTLSDHASDEEAAKLAEAENRADVISGVDLTSEPDDVAGILIDFAQRETKRYSLQFANDVVTALRGAARLHKHPLKSAGFKVLKAPDVPSVLIELGYVSNSNDLKELMSQSWRAHAGDAIVKAVNAYFTTRLASGPAQ